MAASDAGATGGERGDADLELVARIQAGDEDAFEALVARYQAPLFRYLLGFVGQREQAEDLLQETFLRAFRAIGRLDDPATLRPWLYRIAHNQACSLLRRRRLLAWLPLGAQHLPAPPADRSAIEAARTTEALARLPPELRAPLLLHLVAGFSYAETAALLGVSEGAVRMRISRGRAAFRAAYEGEE
jgi:RNA polymerase sigma-70 factor (ECF subfamily)